MYFRYSSKPYFVKDHKGTVTQLTKTNTLQIRNGPFRSNRTKRIPVRMANSATRLQALRYPDKALWVRRMNVELDQTDTNRTIRWLRPAELGITTAKTKITTLTLTFNYKLRKDGSTEERNGRESLRGDLMRPFTD